MNHLSRRTCRYREARLLGSIAAVLFSACVSAAGDSTVRDNGGGGVLAAYALYTQNQDSGATVTLARVVLDGAGQVCPDISAVTSMQTRTNPDPANFPITVCEGLYSSTTAVSVPGSALSLPPINTSPETVIVFGDSGYKSKQLKHKDGWPFPQLATQAAGQSPDLVLHMGDYNYSGTPGEIHVHDHAVQVYDAGDNTT